MSNLEKVLKAAVNHKASDVHVTPGEPYILRRYGRLIKLKSNVLSATRCRQEIFEILSKEQQKRLLKDLQLDFAFEVPNLGRFRGSAMLHHNGMSVVFRIIPPEIPSFEELGLPEIITKILDNHQGIILVTGATGHGKSTTLAAMVDYINTSRAHHILTNGTYLQSACSYSQTARSA